MDNTAVKLVNSNAGEPPMIIFDRPCGWAEEDKANVKDYVFVVVDGRLLIECTCQREDKLCRRTPTLRELAHYARQRGLD